MARWTIEGLRNGVVYAIQGIRITVKNPALHNEKFLRVFIYLSIMSFVLYGVSYILVTIPIQFIQSYWWIVQAEDVGGREERLESIRETIDEVVASIPLLGLMFMRHFYSKPLDGLFMESLRYLDTVYPQRPAYYAPLVQLKKQKNYKDDLKIYVKRWWIKLRMGLAILILSYTPFIGQFMFPLAGAYTTYKSLGNTQGIVVGICFCFLPRWVTMMLVRALIGMRTLVRELLAPYFKRMHLTHHEKRRWFSPRKDVLFGFSAIAYLIIRIPVVGIVGYGISQASVAYMLTIVTDPPNIEQQKLHHDDEKSKELLEQKYASSLPEKKIK